MEKLRKVKNFKELIVWQQGILLVKRVYILTKLFPKEEMFGLTQQIRRAAVSIPSNIAEGFNRYHPAEKKQFLRVASGSAAEVETQLIIAKELGYLSEDECEELSNRIQSICKMITSAILKVVMTTPYVAEEVLDISYQIPTTPQYD